VFGLFRTRQEAFAAAETIGPEAILCEGGVSG
jgi:hypothetical protein